ELANIFCLGSEIKLQGNQSGYDWDVITSSFRTHLRLRPANKNRIRRHSQIPHLRVYRKHDRSLRGPTSWIKQQ
ncbi:hypothetical protein L9F63_016205, partial [Diploptera punctata]